MCTIDTQLIPFPIVPVIIVDEHTILTELKKRDFVKETR